MLEKLVRCEKIENFHNKEQRNKVHFTVLRCEKMKKTSIKQRTDPDNSPLLDLLGFAAGKKADLGYVRRRRRCTAWTKWRERGGTRIPPPLMNPVSRL